ncbi:MAG: hypothetical protein JSW11_03115 [Candidatus Heimdallarchaeota archaeon]|nr:MAG: hypothetical protein JSW11_03115 [Candidatus Heimdallarchaeota archaeon]
MSEPNYSFTDRIKASLRKKVAKEVDSFQTFDQEYKLSSHPIKKTFIAIGKLNKVHKGRIGIAEIAEEVELSENDVVFIIQEFIEQRLIEGYIEENQTPEDLSDDLLVLQQDYYWCQIDQMEHDIFELHFQCTRCLRFICSDCYQKGNSDTCPYCSGSLIPVPRIFKKDDVQTTYAPDNVKASLKDYYETQRYNVSRQGVKAVSRRVIDDLKGLNLKERLSYSILKTKTRTYLDYRKHEKAISENEKLVIDTISALYEIEERSQIPVKRIAIIAKLEINLTHEIISRLISQQSLQGFIETSGTYDTIDDDVLILGSDKYHCEIHNEDLPVSKAHYQCTNCFRAVCENCYSEMKDQGMANCLFCGSSMTFFPDSFS